ncbi:hypothetical protein AURDEDRAFT_162260 [Auricularia subglabra TFB-10046 SS5]|nr:hypothetical protein AURDEDRAFT_162260 [Auricularia subglabra TFB-10046 SS5]
MDVVEHGKTWTELAILVGEGLGLLTGAAGITHFGKRWIESAHVQKMREAWTALNEQVKRMEREDVPVKTYFPRFFTQCQEELNVISREVTRLGQLWDKDERWIRFLSPMDNCVKRAKVAFDRLESLQSQLNNSSIEAVSLQAEDHPIPGPDVFLCPNSATWPAAPPQGTRAMSPAQHLAFRRAQGMMAGPQTAAATAPPMSPVTSPTFVSPAASTASLGYSYQTAPQAAPPSTNHQARPQAHNQGGMQYSAAQMRSNSTPVPPQYAQEIP